MKELFEIQANICKALSNPKRVEIVYSLKGGEVGVSEIVKEVGLSKANVSQHLAVLRNAGIVKARRDGLNVYYSIANEKIVSACSTMREFLIESIEHDKELLNRIKKIK